MSCCLGSFSDRPDSSPKVATSEGQPGSDEFLRECRVTKDKWGPARVGSEDRSHSPFTDMTGEQEFAYRNEPTRDETG